LLSALSRDSGTFYNVSGSNQTTVRLAQLTDDDVDCVMQPVREIAVEMTGWTEQGFVPIGHAAIRVCPGISFAGVRLDLGDPDGNRRLDIGALEYAAEKGWGDFEYVASKETTTRTAHSVKVAHRAIVPVTLEHLKQLEVVPFSQQTGERWHTNRVSKLRHPPQAPRRAFLEAQP
jgi:hypothetical protein